MTKKQEVGLSYEIKLVMVLVLLFVLYPVGLILMFKWMNWPMWIKLILCAPVLIAIIIGFTFSLDFSKAKEVAEQTRIENRIQKLDEAEKLLNCNKKCASYADVDIDNCVNICLK